jgi:hypothetical protein
MVQTCGRFGTPSSRVHRDPFNVLWHGRYPALEAYLADFDGDLYGEPVTVSPGTHIRQQMTFESIETLIGQMHADIEATWRWSELARNRSGHALRTSVPSGMLG